MSGTEPFNMQELFVTLGRIEGKVDAQTSAQENFATSLTQIDGRLRIVEVTQTTHGAELQSVKDQRNRRATWPQIIGAIAGVLTGVSVVAGLFIMLANILQIASQIK